jgi:hypothetical protein
MCDLSRKKMARVMQTKMIRIFPGNRRYMTAARRRLERTRNRSRKELKK